MRINTPAVNHQTIEGEVVAINLASGVYYSMLDVATVIWERLVAGVPGDQIVDELALAYPESDGVASACEAFLEELRSEQLLVEGEAAADGPTPQTPLPPSFTAPLLEKFTDMQELLLLDPIHEVDEAGWPSKPPTV